MKVTPDELRMFYKMFGLPLEITTAYELDELERKHAEVRECCTTARTCNPVLRCNG